MFTGAGKWLHTGAYTLVWAVIRRVLVCTSSVLFDLTMLTIQSLSACHQLAPASAADWFNQGCAMCNHVYVIMHIK